MVYQLIITLCCFIPFQVFSQCFITGADLSYTNQILKENGAYYNANGEDVNPYVYFANEGTKMVRLRLWHTPSNIIDHCGQPILSGSLEDVLEAAKKVKENGMQLKLSIHYGDYFVDPSKQQMPKAWENLAHIDLLDSITNYTLFVLNKLNAQNTLPEIVSVGNETTWGFIDETSGTNGFNWAIDADKFNAGLSAIDAFNSLTNSKVQKAIHLTEDFVEWAVKEFQENGVTNYDIIGFSYYPFFSPNTEIEKVGEIVKDLIEDYEKEVMIFETGFTWSSTAYSDNYSNFISNNGSLVSYPMSPQGQKEFLLDLCQVVDENGGEGVIYWEPGWITSNMCDKWGQGSSYENVSMFDTENKALSSFDFFSYCGVNSLHEEPLSKVLVYPNPVDSNMLFIENVLIQSNWKLTNQSGKVVLEGELNRVENSNCSIDLQNIPKGIYFLEISTDDAKDKVVEKVIVN